MERGLLAHAPDPAAIDGVFPPRRLRKNAGEMGFVSTVQEAAGHSRHALVGEDDEPSQVVLKMPKLALVVKQVAEDRGMIADHRCRRDNRPFPHTPPGPCRSIEPSPRVAPGSQHGKSQLSSHVYVRDEASFVSIGYDDDHSLYYRRIDSVGHVRGGDLLSSPIPLATSYPLLPLRRVFVTRRFLVFHRCRPLTIHPT